jgi:3-hydroxyisobutyrate dehydrogenase
MLVALGSCDPYGSRPARFAISGWPHGGPALEGVIAMSRVGWLGLGSMGAPMAVRIARSGHLVTGYDVRPERSLMVAADGVRRAESIAGAVGVSDVVVIMVATADQAEDVLFSSHGAANAIPSGSVVMITSTVGPEFVVSAADRLVEREVALVDAPVSGGVRRAGDGDLLIMPAGAAEAIGRVMPILDALARSAPVVGSSPGDGQRMKLVNQLLCGVHIAVAAEAIAFAESLGLDTLDCWNILRQGAAASFMLDDRGPRMIAGNFGEALSALDIFVKDMGLVTSAAKQAGAPVPLATAARQLYERGHILGLGRFDDSATIEVLRGLGRREAVGHSDQQPGTRSESPPCGW